MDDSEKIPSTPNSGSRHSPLQRFRRRVRRTVPFAAGVLAALAAIGLYSILFPGPHIFTQREVNDSVARALASATPPPAFSARVYQVIRPALVLVETCSPAENGLVSNNIRSHSRLLSSHLLHAIAETHRPTSDDEKS